MVTLGHDCQVKGWLVRRKTGFSLRCEDNILILPEHPSGPLRIVCGKDKDDLSRPLVVLVPEPVHGTRVEALGSQVSLGQH